MPNSVPSVCNTASIVCSVCIEDLQRRWVPTSKYFIYAYLCIPWRHIGGISAMDADYMRTRHRICDRIFCENLHIAYFSAYINCVFKIAYAEIVPYMQKFAYLRTSPHMRCRIFCIFSTYFSALFRQIPYIFPHILHQNGPHILRKISTLWSCVWCFFYCRSQEWRPAFTPPIWCHTKWCLKFELPCKSSIKGLLWSSHFLSDISLFIWLPTLWFSDLL